MAKGEQRGNREAKKPKKEKAKLIAAAQSRKEAGWRPDFGPDKEEVAQSRQRAGERESEATLTAESFSAGGL